LTATIKKLWKNEYFQTAIIITIIMLTFFAFFIAEILGYVAVVQSGSMCIPYDSACDGWTHPFDRTLHVGDIIIIQPVNAADLNTNYPDSDIIVYNTAQFGLVVHRITAQTEVNGKLYFYTKGDGNGRNKWPSTPSSEEYDSWSPISQDDIVGKVVMRIPWIGHFTIFMQNIIGGNNNYIALLAVVILITLFIVVELIIPLLKRKKATAQEKANDPDMKEPAQTPTKPTPAKNHASQHSSGNY
jgi:signal peptidase I